MIPQFRCELCNQLFKTDKYYLQHTDKRKTPCVYKCHRCHSVFETKRQLNAHEKYKKKRCLPKALGMYPENAKYATIEKNINTTVATNQILSNESPTKKLKINPILPPSVIAIHSSNELLPVKFVKNEDEWIPALGSPMMDFPRDDVFPTYEVEYNRILIGCNNNHDKYPYDIKIMIKRLNKYLLDIRHFNRNYPQYKNIYMFKRKTPIKITDEEKKQFCKHELYYPSYWDGKHYVELKNKTKEEFWRPLTVSLRNDHRWFKNHMNLADDDSRLEPLELITTQSWKGLKEWWFEYLAQKTQEIRKDMPKVIKEI